MTQTFARCNTRRTSEYTGREDAKGCFYKREDSHNLYLALLTSPLSLPLPLPLPLPSSSSSVYSRSCSKDSRCESVATATPGSTVTTSSDNRNTNVLNTTMSIFFFIKPLCLALSLFLSDAFLQLQLRILSGTVLAKIPLCVAAARERQPTLRSVIISRVPWVPAD